MVPVPQGIARLEAPRFARPLGGLVKVTSHVGHRSRPNHCIGMVWQVPDDVPGIPHGLIDIAGIIRRHSRPQTVILVDCLTLWLTNLIIGETDDKGIQQRIAVLEETLSGAPGPVLLVANEVGLGIVPDNAMSRRFRDWAGSLNQRMARCAREVILTVAGIPIPIKSLTKVNLQEDE